MTEEKEEEAITNENYRFLSDKEREKKVIEFYFFKGKKYKYISTAMEMSYSTIADIIKK
jgi:DNA-directed RNA polymerase specialized sigma subunit